MTLKHFILHLVFSQVHNILAEMVMGGMVLETNMNEIITQVDAQNKMEKSEVSLTLPHPLYVWLDSHILWGTVYSMQACVYAAPCMPLSGDLVNAPYLLLSVCALFPASPLAAALLPTQVLNISSPVSHSIKYSIIVITFVIIMET